MKYKIFGKGGHANVISSFIRKDQLIGLWDESDYLSAPTTGKWIVAIGDNSIRERIVKEVLVDYRFASVISINSIIRGNIGIGTSVHDFSTIQANSSIGDHCIINTSSSIDHDCQIDSFVHIAPNSTLCGGVKVGAGSMIGAGSVILPNIRIGKNSIIGAGSVVTKDIGNGCKGWGNPYKTYHKL